MAMKGIFSLLPPTTAHPEHEQQFVMNQAGRSVCIGRGFGPKAIFSSNIFGSEREDPRFADTINGFFDLCQGEVGFGALIVGTNVGDAMPSKDELAALAAALRPLLIVEIYDLERQCGICLGSLEVELPLYPFERFLRVRDDGELVDL
ncbi:hypothetical protein OAO01_01285 [Oligoflexia bacterium]|nr:hypothetical protein [Oligoflexia bacterium]